ncbi:hypothetical protein QFC21_004809 [Naganishia friedmannii]|uniref:Uncharacterized protein n=1 Tax=Naganishia friedmannii TaxID=89922 RepID=A0ACC2VDX7_9TREE|nr:hypothetical protein QFC21_004809 [Naganishia friedmannii]
MTGIRLDSGAAGKREVAVSYRLEKYAVEFLGGEDDGADTSTQRPAMSCTVDECLAIEMLEHAQSLGIRKFVVFDEQAEEERLFIPISHGETYTWTCKRA